MFLVFMLVSSAKYIRIIFKNLKMYYATLKSRINKVKCRKFLPRILSIADLAHVQWESEAWK